MPQFYNTLSCSMILLLAFASYQQLASGLRHQAANGVMDEPRPLQEFGYDFELPTAKAHCLPTPRFMLVSTQAKLDQ